MTKFSKAWLLTLLGGLLPILAWPTINLVFLIFIAFVPFFALENHLRNTSRKGFGWYTYVGLLVFNIGTTWWVWNASPGGAVFMVVANSFLMTIPFLLYRFALDIIPRSNALILFTVAWLSFEYYHFRWPLAYPWLTLGNSFAASPDLVQWYEFTGALGGSLWIVVVNLLIFEGIRATRPQRFAWAGIAVLAPIIWSISIKPDPLPKAGEILIVQPNIDPYKKFDGISAEEQVQGFVELAESQIDSSTDLVIFPETALIGNDNENYLHYSNGVQQMQAFLKRHPGTNMLIGASTHRFYKLGEQLPAYPRVIPGTTKYYDSYNTALQLNGDGTVGIYHKSKLVPGVESLPFPKFFKLFDNILKLDFGGVSGNLGRDKEAKTFHFTNESTKLSIAPLICYESVFGAYVGDFVNREANVLAVITNDGWWKNTPGHKQHMHYARLRAIEYRRDVVRSANTGISCYIDHRGEIHERLKWWECGTLTVKVGTNDAKTFYAKSGDYIGKLAIFIAVFLGLTTIVKWILARNN